MPTITYRNFLRIILGNLDKLDDLMALASELVAAGTIAEKWEVIYQIGKLLLAMDIPELSPITTFADLDVKELESQIQNELAGKGYAAQAWDGTRLRRLFDSVLPVLIQILPILLAR